MSRPNNPGAADRHTQLEEVAARLATADQNRSAAARGLAGCAKLQKMALYDHIGQKYDTTRQADPYIANRLAHHLHIQPERYYLDVACGTGNYTLALAQRGGSWHAVDQSPHMIAAARAKGKFVQWEVAGATSLPYGDAIFNGVVCTLAIHHFDALLPTFHEVHRVLKSGPFVLLTATPEQIQGYWLARYFPEAIRKAAEQMPSLEVVSEALHDAGFARVETEPYQVAEDLQDFFLYSGKHRPELYLDAQVRAGISTFALFADAAEVEAGCEQLAADVESGYIEEILEHHKQTSDYLFTIATA
ncbi:MAG: methyltransferase domain-containing protein [Myxacorys chilensis ATA2-1-KO14]|jgi:ubiquinone/menaquinone biosynthesis C-methylase UbiE|nr:methyltransferase domain-containing protein [Myxacorys chilensis ATA2-1-KO14]